MMSVSISAFRSLIVISFFLLVPLLGCRVESPDMYSDDPPAPEAVHREEPEQANVSIERDVPAPVAEAAPPEPAEPVADFPAENKEEPQKQEDNTETVKATVGSGKKGHYGEPGAAAFVTVPITALFRSKERVAFEILIPQALQLYKANNDDKGPPDHETFMRDIIEFNNIALPQLRDGEEYFYDAVRGELMIRKPK